MNIKKIIELLPQEITEDLYFQDLWNVVMANFKDAQLIAKVQVNQDIYEKIDNKDLIFPIESDVIVAFKYLLKDAIYSFSVKKNKEADLFYVYLEQSSYTKMVRTILIKGMFGVIVETKETLKENGVFKIYKSNVYYYDSDYNKISIDLGEILDKLFSDDFGIPINMAKVMRKNFSFYNRSLTVLYSEHKMKNYDDKLTDIDFLYFRSPWLVSDVKEFIEEEYNKTKNAIIKKVFNKKSNLNHLNNMAGIEKIIDWIQNNLGSNSEFVISDNIYQNLIPILVGEYFTGYNTRGIIIEKINDSFYMYQVHFMTNQIIFTKSLITKEEAQNLFLANPLNQNVEGLSAFFGITRGR